ncbi:MAG: M55 family metallopeptidase [Spirochaetes bacterium]|nr:M55 family metallopeptidase [Spirochaetota bacterium]
MKRILITVFILSVFVCSIFSQNNLKVFISVDMEGITGVVNWEDVRRDGKDYGYFREVMTKETNAAIEGAIEAGAKEIIVRDSHGSARNLLPEMLNKNSKLIRDWSGGFMSMMEGINETFDAVVFVGYHAKAGTPNAILEHTMSSKNIIDVAINNVSMPEAGLNALIAGHYDVPVVFVAGEKALCDQAKNLFGEVTTFAVKEGLGNAALNFHPEVSREKIRAGVKDALLNLSKFKPYKLEEPYTLVVKYKNEEIVNDKSLQPGVQRTGDWELTYKSDDILYVNSQSPVL